MELLRGKAWWQVFRSLEERECWSLGLRANWPLNLCLSSNMSCDFFRTSLHLSFATRPSLMKYACEPPQLETSNPSFLIVLPSYRYFDIEITPNQYMTWSNVFIYPSFCNETMNLLLKAAIIEDDRKHSSYYTCFSFLAYFSSVCLPPLLLLNAQCSW